MDGEDSALAIFGADCLLLLASFRKYLSWSRSYKLLKDSNGGQRWKVFLIPAPITLTTSVNQQLTLTWLTVKGTNGSTVLSTFKSFYKPRRSFWKGGVRRWPWRGWVGVISSHKFLSFLNIVKRSLLSKGGLNVTIPLPADWLNRLTVLTGATTWPWNSLKNYRLKPYVEWFFSMFSNNT